MLGLMNSIFRSCDSIYYIGSQIYLPSPLKEEEERMYVDLLSSGDKNARDILIEHNMRLVVFIAKRFESKKVLLEDLISIGSMGLIKGVETFKPDKNIKLGTYASRCIENEILMFLRKIAKERQEVSLDEPLNVDGDGNELLLSDVIASEGEHPLDEILKDERNKVMYEALTHLRPREKDIVVMRFGLFGSSELTQKEVADKLGISQSYISRLEKKIMIKLKNEMEKKIIITSI